MDYFKTSLNRSLPLMQRWGSSSLSSIKHDLQTYQEQLNSLDWDIQQYNFMAATMRLETMRVLLPGERVYNWHMGPSKRHVASPIPSSILWSCGMTGPKLGAALEGYDASTLLKHSLYYQQYIQENLLE